MTIRCVCPQHPSVSCVCSDGVCVCRQDQPLFNVIFIMNTIPQAMSSVYKELAFNGTLSARMSHVDADRGALCVCVYRRCGYRCELSARCVAHCHLALCTAGRVRCHRCVVW